MLGLKMRTRKPDSLFSPPSLFILALATGAAIWISKTKECEEDC
ncbi:hypothetical protein [Desulfosporosinus meridiei]|uniref:Uncharacterized protein n=1 Tax=Desulfosporosinus meridiei (strain ATCC BAA-275 / DSM 13257 / KCTC 12902 / NCIMB 13706 / S10) TaxID=768704 RepID=J7IZL0_DESMD|nr:hypothetical protein [Desulfosporosinus meridiei]AFQ44151.1 hypothetical protein Desmer_2213 [Desulfosporosinus meridiei DSM 13257]